MSRARRLAPSPTPLDQLIGIAHGQAGIPFGPAAGTLAGICKQMLLHPAFCKSTRRTLSDWQARAAPAQQAARAASRARLAEFTAQQDVNRTQRHARVMERAWESGHGCLPCCNTATEAYAACCAGLQEAQTQLAEAGRRFDTALTRLRAETADALFVSDDGDVVLDLHTDPGTALGNAARAAAEGTPTLALIQNPAATLQAMERSGLNACAIAAMFGADGQKDIAHEGLADQGPAEADLAAIY